MNTQTTQETRLRFVPAVLVAAVLAALVGCSDRDTTSTTPPPAQLSTVDKAQAAAGEAWDKTKETSKEVYADAKDAISDGADKLERATYDERVSIKAGLSDAAAKLDTKFSEWRAEGKPVSATTEQKIATAKASFSESLSELGDATASTWDAAKAKTAAAWTSLKAAYAEAKDAPATAK
ncbi:MAG: hypothetical protein H7067_04680 [Burkholderiales bacterium]|nr:hypothetical protein [Opitutaceae bacterium]